MNRPYLSVTWRALLTKDVFLTQVQTCDNAVPFTATLTLISEWFWSLECVYLHCDRARLHTICTVKQKSCGSGDQTEISEITDYQNIPHLVNVLLMGWMHFCLFVCLVLFCLHSQVSWSITLFLTMCRLKITSRVKSLSILVSFDAFCNYLIVALSHEVKEDNRTCCFQNVFPQISQEPASDPGCVSTLAGCTLVWGNL